MSRKADKTFATRDATTRTVNRTAKVVTSRVAPQAGCRGAPEGPGRVPTIATTPKAPRRPVSLSDSSCFLECDFRRLRSDCNRYGVDFTAAHGVWAQLQAPGTFIPTAVAIETAAALIAAYCVHHDKHMAEGHIILPLHDPADVHHCSLDLYAAAYQWWLDDSDNGSGSDDISMNGGDRDSASYGGNSAGDGDPVSPSLAQPHGTVQAAPPMQDQRSPHQAADWPALRRSPHGRRSTNGKDKHMTKSSGATCSACAPLLVP